MKYFLESITALCRYVVANKFRCWASYFGIVILTVQLSGCAYPIRNVEAGNLSLSEGYRQPLLNEPSMDETLVIVTISGGGTRATALGLSVLEGLEGIKLPDGGNLVDEIDIISSVSGGSVTAAYFALAGTEGFEKLEKDFIRQNGIRALLISGLNPVGLALLSTPSKERIDLLIDYLDETIFDHATYNSLLGRNRQPFLILNAADMVEGIPFAFTQANFDLLCSDLGSMDLSVAVAASAAFPVALSPVTLKNYSRCEAQKSLSRDIRTWVRDDADTIWNDNPERARRGRVSRAYAEGDSGSREYNKLFVHLLDGGIADNLGISEPLRILTTSAPAPGLLDQISSGHIKRIIFVSVNARSFSTSELDEQQATPGMVDMLTASINSSIDRASAGTGMRIRDELDQRFDVRLQQLRKYVEDSALSDITRELIRRRIPNIEAVKANTFLIEVDFDAIENEECRLAFQDISTSWTLSDEKIDALLEVGSGLLLAAPEFPAMIKSINGKPMSPKFPEMADFVDGEPQDPNALLRRACGTMANAQG